MRIVEDRSFSDAELLLAVKADGEDSGRYGLLFELAGLPIGTHARAGLLHILRDALAVAVDALRTFRPAHLFEEIIAGFRSGERFGYVYEVHLRPLDVVCA